MNALTAWLLACIVALLLAWFGPVALSGPSEMDAVQAVADEVNELNGGGK